VKKVTPPTKQREAFIDAARALECDESEERFDAALKKIAAQKPPNYPGRGIQGQSRAIPGISDDRAPDC
jgi:hypothetical protein